MKLKVTARDRYGLTITLPVTATSLHYPAVVDALAEKYPDMSDLTIKAVELLED